MPSIKPVAYAKEPVLHRSRRNNFGVDRTEFDREENILKSIARNLTERYGFLQFIPLTTLDDIYPRSD
jgi:hypothetical protein